MNTSTLTKAVPFESERVQRLAAQFGALPPRLLSDDGDEWPTWEIRLEFDHETGDRVDLTWSPYDHEFWTIDPCIDTDSHLTVDQALAAAQTLDRAARLAQALNQPDADLELSSYELSLGEPRGPHLIALDVSLKGQPAMGLHYYLAAEDELKGRSIGAKWGHQGSRKEYLGTFAVLRTEIRNGREITLLAAI